MKPRILSTVRLSLPLAAALAALLAGSAVTSIHAAALHWDGNDTTADADGGAGTWNTSTANWDSAATGGANAVWNIAPPDSATFGGTADAVTLGADIYVAVAGLTFAHGSGTYAIGGTNSLTLVANAALITTVGGTTNITAPVNLVAGTNTITNNGSLSLSTINLLGGVTLSSTTSSLTIGSITSVPNNSLTLGGAGGASITGSINLGTVSTLSKTGESTYTISGANFWAAGTTISQGSLILGNANVLGGFGTGALTFGTGVTGTNQTLDLNGNSAGAGNFTGGLAASNRGLVTNTAAATTPTLTIGNGNGTGGTYVGLLNDGAGTVALAKVGTGTITIASASNNSLTGGLTLNGGTLVLDNVNLATPTDLVNSTNPIALGGGTLSIKGKNSGDTFQTLGNVTANAGGGQILVNPNNGTSSTLTLGSLNATAVAGSLNLGQALSAGVGALTLTTTTDKDAQGIYSGRVVFADGTANTGYNWATTASGSSPYALSAYSGYLALNTAGGSDTDNSLITASDILLADLATNSLKIENPAASQILDLGIQLLTLSSGGLLVTGTNATSISGTGTTGLTAANGSGSYDLVVHQFNSGGLTVSAVIGDNGGNAVNLVKAGTSLLTLTGTNTYTGQTYVNAGALTLNSANSTSAGTTLMAGGTLNLGNALALGSGDLTINGGILNNSFGSAITLSNALNLNRSFTVSGSAITQQTGAVALGGNLIITVSAPLTIDGGISGTGYGITKLSTSTLTLGNTNTYTGPTSVMTGTLQLNGSITSTEIRISGPTANGGAAGAILNLGASDLLPSSARVTVDGQGANYFDLKGFNQTIGSLLLGSNNGGGQGTARDTVGGGVLTVTGGVTMSGHNNGAGAISVGTLDLNGTNQTFYLVGSNNATSSLYVSSVIQNGGLNYYSTTTTGFLALSGANTYSGPTKIIAGKVQLDNKLALQNSPLDTSGAGVINANNGAGAYTIGGITGSKNLASVITTGLANVTTLTLNPQSGTLSYSGVIAANGAMGMTKTGMGTQILSNTNTYTGATDITDGTLLVNSPGSLHLNSAVTVNGGTLGGNGIINGSVTVAADGSLAPGASAGTLSIGTDLDISAQAGGTGKLNFELDALANTNDKIVVTGTLTIGVGALGFSDFIFTNLGGLQVTGGTPYKLITSGGLAALNTLDPANLSGPLGGGLTGTLQITGNDVELVVTSGGDATPPTLLGVNIVDDKSGGPITVNTLVTYTITFSEDIDHTTVTSADFSNAGTSAITIGTITETTPTSGIFTVQVTPTSAGTLQLRVPTTAVITDAAVNPLDNDPAIDDNTTITVQTPFQAWSGGANFGFDTNNDCIDNGMAWVLGAANPAANATALLPTFDNTTDATYFIYTYRRSDAANTAAGITIAVQYSSDLTNAGWTTAVAGPDIIITPTDNFYSANTDRVEVKINRTLAVGDKLFVRLITIQN